MSINVASNFDLSAGLALDARTFQADIAARDAIPAVQRHEGLIVYVVSEASRYMLVGGIDNADWKLINSNYGFNYYFINPDGSSTYSSYADAVAAADAAGDDEAFFVLLAALTEDVSIQKGRKIGALAQAGNDVINLTGRFEVTGGTGVAQVINLGLVADGTQSIFSSDAACNVAFTNCVLVQTADFPFFESSAGGNVSMTRCIFFGTGLNTAPGIDQSEGSIALVSTSCLSINNGIFAVKTGGSFSCAQATSIEGTFTNTSGGFSATNTLFSVTAGPCFDTDDDATLIDCQISSTAAATNALRGTGTITFSNLRFINTQKGVDSSLTFVPYYKQPEALYTIEASAGALNAVNGPNYIGVTRTTTGSCTINLPTAATADGIVFIIKDEGLNCSANNITLNPNGVETIDGAGSYVMSTDGQSITLVSRDGNWWIN